LVANDPKRSFKAAHRAPAIKLELMFARYDKFRSIYRARI